MKDWMWLDEVVDLSDQQMAFLHALGSRARVWSSFTPCAGKYDPHTMRRWHCAGGGVEVEIGAAQDRECGRACKFDDGKVIDATPMAAVLNLLISEAEQHDPDNFIMKWDIEMSESDFTKLVIELEPLLSFPNRRKYRTPTYRGHRIWISPSSLEAPRLVRNPLFGLDIGLKPAFSAISVAS